MVSRHFFRPLGHRNAAVPIMIIAVIIVLDRISKVCVSSYMTPGESFRFVGEILKITYVRNSGAAFSMFSGHTMLIAVLTGAAIAVIIVWIIFRSKSLFYSIPLAMIAGGGVGNLFDRIRYGYVIDMLDLKSFAVFNVADIFVCCGCILLCIAIIFSGKKDE